MSTRLRTPRKKEVLFDPYCNFQGLFMGYVGWAYGQLNDLLDHDSFSNLIRRTFIGTLVVSGLWFSVGVLLNYVAIMCYKHLTEHPTVYNRSPMQPVVYTQPAGISVTTANPQMGEGGKDMGSRSWLYAQPAPNPNGQPAAYPPPPY